MTLEAIVAHADYIEARHNNNVPTNLPSTAHATVGLMVLIVKMLALLILAVQSARVESAPTLPRTETKTEIEAEEEPNDNTDGTTESLALSGDQGGSPGRRRRRRP